MSNEELEKQVNELERRVDWLYQMSMKQSKINSKLIEELDELIDITKTNSKILIMHTVVLNDITDNIKED